MFFLFAESKPISDKRVTCQTFFSGCKTVIHKHWMLKPNLSEIFWPLVHQVSGRRMVTALLQQLPLLMVRASSSFPHLFHPINKISMSPPDYQMCKNIMNIVSFLPYFSIPDWMWFPSLGFEGHWQLKLLPVWASACLSIHLLPVLWSALRCHCFRLTWSALLLFLLCYNDAQTFTYNPLYSQGLRKKLCGK